MNNENGTLSPVGPISVVLTVHDQADALRRNLPVLLEQHYEPGYEVIVVDESSSDETADVLKHLVVEHAPILYSTYIPASSHYVSRKKLALTVGIKAAHYEWVILTEADCHPETQEWLTSMANNMNNDIDLVCGYTGYEQGTKGGQSYRRLYNFNRQKSQPYRYDGANIAIRKSTFMKRNGFLKNLKYLRGEYEFLVNETEPKRIAVAMDSDSRMRQEPPTDRNWTSSQLYYMQIRSHLSRTFLPRLRAAMYHGTLHLFYLAFITSAVFFLSVSMPIYAACSFTALMLFFCLHAFLCHRRQKVFGEHIAIVKLPFLELAIPWQFAYYRLRYLLADKYDYTRK